MDEQKINELMRLIDDLNWDYYRFSLSGKKTYDKIRELFESNYKDRLGDINDD
jgi:hypothetical protein